MNAGNVDLALGGYAQAWEAIAAAGIAAWWDASAFRFYKAEEAPRFFTRWDEAVAYWQGNEAFHASVALRFGSSTILEARRDGVLAVARMDWRIGFRDDATASAGGPFRHAGRTMGGFNHVLMAWRIISGEPRLTGWCEVPDAAPLYLTELYYRAGA